MIVFFRTADDWANEILLLSWIYALSAISSKKY